MNDKKVTIKTALLSVSDKTGLLEFAKQLREHGVNIISTGGTAKTLQDAGIELKLVSDITGFPEIMQGRVKTLHPKIHGGILGKRDKHQDEADEHGIPWIDLVVCNLYPFQYVIQKENTTLETAIENIDIGGPAMIRAAAKNFSWTTVITTPSDYHIIAEELQVHKGVSYQCRKDLAQKAFAHTASYDSNIYNYLNHDNMPEHLLLAADKLENLRYGENPHQQAAIYKTQGHGLLSTKKYQGKELSYNNIGDTEAALECLNEFQGPTCVVVKHANPCGVSQAADLFTAFKQAFEADSKSAFGGIIALNQNCTKQIAEYLRQVFFEIIIAPSFDKGALDLFAKKKNLRVLELPDLKKHSAKLKIKSLSDGFLVQTPDDHTLEKSKLELVTSTNINDEIMDDLIFSWKVAKHVKSNAILIADKKTTLGVGAGQVSRVDAVEIALKKAGEFEHAVLASDAFFPFRDSIDSLANKNIHAIIQPGGSVRDEEVIAACNELGIAMVFTGKRCFNH